MMTQSEFDHLIFDFSPDNLDAETVVQACDTLKQFNCIHLKNALDTDHLANLITEFQTIGKSVGLVSPPNGHLYSAVSNAGGLNLPFFNLLREEPLFSLLTANLACEELTIPLFSSAFRTITATPNLHRTGQETDVSRLAYHQDSRACDPEIWGDMAIAWIPLIPRDFDTRDTPALKLVPGSKSELVESPHTPDDPSKFGYLPEEEALKQLIDQNGEWVPNVSFGDVVLFSGYCVHGTHVTPDMTRDRLSCEIKVFPYRAPITETIFKGDDFRSHHFILAKSHMAGPASTNGTIPFSRAASETSSIVHGTFPPIWSFNMGCLESAVYQVEKSPAAGPSSNAREQTDILAISLPNNNFWPFLQALYPGRPWTTVVAEKLPHPSGRDGVPGIEICHSWTLSYTCTEIQRHKTFTSLKNPVQFFLDRFLAENESADLGRLEQALDEMETLDALPSELIKIAGNDVTNISDRENPNPQDFASFYESLFDFVCMEEWFCESIWALCGALSIETVSLPRTYKTSRSRISMDEIPDTLVEKIRSKMPIDLAIYERASVRHRRSLEKISDKHRLAEFQKAFSSVQKHVDELETSQATYLAQHMLKIISNDTRFAAISKQSVETQGNLKEVDMLRGQVASLEALVDAQKVQIERMHEFAQTKLQILKP